MKRAKAPGARLPAVAADLGVSTSTLRRWVRAHDTSLASPTERLASPPAEPAAEPVAEPVAEPAAESPAEPAEPAAGPPAEPAGHTASDDGPEESRHDRHEDVNILAMLDSILEMFPKPATPRLEDELSMPGPGATRDGEEPEDRIPLHPGDDIFPALPRLLPVYRFPLILATLLGAVMISRVVPSDYALRPAAVALHVLSLVVSFGAVLVVDWHGLLWLGGRRGLSESIRLAAGASPLIWFGLGGLIASGALLHPNLSSPMTVTKLVLVLVVAWNGAAMTELRRRLAQLPPYVKPGDLPRRDWRLMMGATVISQVGWWGAILIGFVNAST